MSEAELASTSGGGWWTRVVAVVGLVGVGVGLGAVGLGGGGEPAPEAAGGGERPPVPVEVVVVEPEDVPLELRFLGQTAASRRVELRSRVMGYVTELGFEEGERVEAGVGLIQVDARPYRLALEEARARLVAAEARQRRAAQQRARYEQLGAQQAATRGEVEQWEAEEAVAAAEVELQRTQIASAELSLDYASIEAPLSGVIGERRCEVGTYVDAAGSAVLAVIEQLDPLYVRYALTEQDLLEFERQRAADEVAFEGVEQLELRIILADGREHPHSGRIDFMEPGLSSSTGTTQVRGVIPNPDGTLRPGQFVHVEVLGVRRLGVMRVPQSAVQHASTGALVYVVGEGDVVEARPVELGEWSGARSWTITGGLSPGDRVITNRLQTLRPGARVAPSEASAAEGGAQ